MKNRIKYLIIISVLLFMVFGIVNAFIEARDKKLEEIKREQDKVALKDQYIIKRQNNKYTISSKRLEGKTLSNIYYDSYNVYLYYDSEENATLLKYNIEESKVVVLFENSTEIHGGFKKIGKFFKLGNGIYNKKFQKVMDYPQINDGELLFPNLKEKLVRRDNSIYIINIETNEEKLIVSDIDEEKYYIYSIKNDGKYFMLKRIVDNREYLSTYNKKGELLNTINSTDDSDSISIEYNLLDDVPYLLKTINNNDEIAYKIYNANNNDLVYTSDNKYMNYKFDDTKFVANTSDNNIILMDYVTGENKVLLQNKNKVNKFILADDFYSLLLTFDNNDKVFYIFYL